MNVNWIPVDEKLPETKKVVEDRYYYKVEGEDLKSVTVRSSDYILLSFSNFPVPAVGRYDEDEDGNGAFFVGDIDTSCSAVGLFVNAWMPMIPPYVEE